MFLLLSLHFSLEIQLILLYLDLLLLELCLLQLQRLDVVDDGVLSVFMLWGLDWWWSMMGDVCVFWSCPCWTGYQRWDRWGVCCMIFGCCVEELGVVGGVLNLCDSGSFLQLVDISRHG